MGDLAEWARSASSDVQSAATEAVGLFELAEKASKSVACEDAVKGQLEDFMDEIGSFESFLSGGIDTNSFEIPDGITIPDGFAAVDVNALVDGAMDAGGGRARRNSDLGVDGADGASNMAEDAVGELNSMVLSVESQIQMIQNFTSDVILKYEVEREEYVGRKSPLATKNLLKVTDAVALCFLLTCSSSDDVIAF